MGAGTTKLGAVGSTVGDSDDGEEPSGKGAGCWGGMVVVVVVAGLLAIAGSLQPAP